MSDATSPAASAGALIRAAREKQGLHIAALAAAIKVAPRKLDALENDRWNELPDATFTRALAQTVCRSLKIDARPVLDLLPPAEPVALEPSAGALNEPFHERAARDEGGLAALAIKPMVVAAAVLMLAAVALYLAPASWWSFGRAPEQAAAPVPAPVVSAAAPAASVAADVAPAGVGLAASAAIGDATAAAGAASVTPGGLSTTPSAAPAAAPPAVAAPAAAPLAAAPLAAASAPATTAETVFSAPQGGAGAPAAVSGAIVLRTSEASWVEVRDGRGRLLLSRTVVPGEGVGLDGEAPFRLVIGNAAATQLHFRGQPVALAPVARDNVARVDLK